MITTQPLRDYSHRAKTLYFRMKMREFLKIYKDYPKIGAITELSYPYCDINELLVQLNRLFLINFSREAVESFLMYSIVGKESLIKNVDFRNALEENFSEMVAPLVYKRDGELELVFNRAYCEKYLEAITFFILEYYASQPNKLKIEQNSLGLVIVYKDIASICIPSEQAAIILERINVMHGNMQTELFINTAKLLRREFITYKDYMHHSNMVQGF